MSSLVTNLNSSTAQEIVNWVTTADGCVHTADTTQPDWQICSDSSRLSPTSCKYSVHTSDAAQLDS